ncbi:MAG: hypothetical protein UD936_03160 [Acutalibacteraceae bacterium]|nr:hypothetical protein [Acutalibacteraceae bacterium]
MNKTKTLRKMISLMLSVMLVLSMCLTGISVSATDTGNLTYVVTGAEELCGVGSTGYGWDPADLTNEMTANADGTYSKVYTDVMVANDYQCKVTITDADGTTTWYGVDGGADNFTFHVVEVCDVTITFNPETLEITATGAGVKIPGELEIDAIRTVGNGDGKWLNGVSWDTKDDSNIMTEVAPDVYEITYTDIEVFDNYQFKFVANGSWAVNWGGIYYDSGVETEAWFNASDNITVEVPYELADVTIRLDLSNFDYRTKTGATFTVYVVNTYEEPTEEPTEAPTVNDTTYVVAGVPALCGTGGTGYGWNSADLTNEMTANADGTYSKVYTDVMVVNGYQFKVTGTNADGVVSWYGIDGGADNVVFNVVKVCDVTITFNPKTLQITVEGDGVEIPSGLKIDAVYTAGNGDGSWLNGAEWDPADDSNKMTEVAPGVYEITYKGVAESDNYQFKFVANGSWAVNWGGIYYDSGVETDAWFDAQTNIIVEVPYELADVTIRLDVSNYDHSTKTGATFTVTVEEVKENPTEEPTEAPTVPEKVSIVGDVELELTKVDTDVYSASTVLEAGEYTFKVNELGTTMGFGYTFTDKIYSVKYSSDYKLATTFNATGGKYTFTYNAATNELTVKFKNYNDIVELCGDINVELAKGADTLYSGIVRLDSGMYEFKVNDKGVVKGLDYTFDDVVDSADLQQDCSSSLTLNANGGIYSVIYDSATSQLTVKHTAPSTSDVRVFGDINLDLVKNGTVYIATKTLEDGLYEFRVDAFGETLCNGTQFTDTVYKVEYKGEWQTATKFNATAGKYFFRFDETTNQLTIYKIA